MKSTMQAKANWVIDQLYTIYGNALWQSSEAPIDTLIGTILSANTNDINSDRAFRQLQERFANDWDAVRAAPLSAIIEAIRPAGMYHQKAPAIVATLQILKQERGNYDLTFLATMPVAEALEYLMRFPGVGRKTAGIVLLFCFDRAAFPVDTHIQRISRRVGIAPANATPDKLSTLWEALLPNRSYYALHLNLIRLGREICDARKPRCAICPLQAECDYFQGSGAWHIEKKPLAE